MQLLMFISLVVGYPRHASSTPMKAKQAMVAKA